MSESESLSPSKYDGLDIAQVELAAIELALDFIDSNVLGILEISMDVNGLTGIKVVRERFSDPLQLTIGEADDENLGEFSPEFSMAQMDLSGVRVRRSNSSPSLEDIEDGE